MPRYHFNMALPAGPRDEVGQELADVQEAKCAAIQLIADTLCKHAQSFWDADSHRVEVTDGTGLTLFHVDLFTSVSPATAVTVRRRRISEA